MTQHRHDPQHCMTLFEKMSEYIDRELGSAELAEVEAHIHACCHCQACYETLRRTVDLCRSSAHDFPLPDSLTEKLHALIEGARR